MDLQNMHTRLFDCHHSPYEVEVTMHQGIGAALWILVLLYSCVPCYCDYADTKGQVLWIHEGQVSPGALSSGDEYGRVSVGEDESFIGAPGVDSSAGSVFHFRRGNGSWSLVGELYPTVRTANSFFGSSVSFSYPFLVVGSWGEDSTKGAAYVYKLSTGNETLVQVKRLVSNNCTVGSRFGHSVSIYGENIVVGAFLNNNRGSVHVFKRHEGSDNNWGHALYISAPSSLGDNLWFGVSVSMSDEFLSSGSKQCAYVYSVSNGTSVSTFCGNITDSFGFVVSMSGHFLAVSASMSNEGKGIVYFCRNILESNVLQSISGGNGMEFGSSLTLDNEGRSLYIGSLGLLEVFFRNESGLYERQFSFAFGTADTAGSCFVSFHSHNLLYGCTGWNDNRGAAYSIVQKCKDPDNWEGSVCDIPICSQGCLGGLCTSPQVCECTSSWYGVDCSSRDVNECEVGSHECHYHGDCLNSVPGYECSCKDPYIGDGKLCIEMKDGAPSNLMMITAAFILLFFLILAILSAASPACAVLVALQLVDIIRLSHIPVNFPEWFLWRMKQWCFVMLGFGRNAEILGFDVEYPQKESSNVDFFAKMAMGSLSNFFAVASGSLVLVTAIVLLLLLLVGFFSSYVSPIVRLVLSSSTEEVVMRQLGSRSFRLRHSIPYSMVALLCGVLVVILLSASYLMTLSSFTTIINGPENTSFSLSLLCLCGVLLGVFYVFYLHKFRVKVNKVTPRHRIILGTLFVGMKNVYVIPVVVAKLFVEATLIAVLAKDSILPLVCITIFSSLLFVLIILKPPMLSRSENIWLALVLGSEVLQECLCFPMFANGKSDSVTLILIWVQFSSVLLSAAWFAAMFGMSVHLYWKSYRRRALLALEKMECIDEKVQAVKMLQRHLDLSVAQSDLQAAGNDNLNLKDTEFQSEMEKVPEKLSSMQKVLVREIISSEFSAACVSEYDVNLEDGCLLKWLYDKVEQTQESTLSMANLEFAVIRPYLLIFGLIHSSEFRERYAANPRLREKYEHIYVHLMDRVCVEIEFLCISLEFEDRDADCGECQPNISDNTVDEEHCSTTTRTGTKKRTTAAVDRYSDTLKDFWNFWPSAFPQLFAVQDSLYPTSYPHGSVHGLLFLNEDAILDEIGFRDTTRGKAVRYSMASGGLNGKRNLIDSQAEVTVITGTGITSVGGIDSVPDSNSNSGPDSVEATEVPIVSSTPEDNEVIRESDKNEIDGESYDLEWLMDMEQHSTEAPSIGTDNTMARDVSGKVDAESQIKEEEPSESMVVKVAEDEPIVPETEIIEAKTVDDSSYRDSQIHGNTAVSEMAIEEINSSLSTEISLGGEPTASSIGEAHTKPTTEKESAQHPSTITTMTPDIDDSEVESIEEVPMEEVEVGETIHGTTVHTDTESDSDSDDAKLPPFLLSATVHPAASTEHGKLQEVTRSLSTKKLTKKKKTKKVHKKKKSRKESTAVAWASQRHLKKPTEVVEADSFVEDVEDVDYMDSEVDVVGTSAKKVRRKKKKRKAKDKKTND